MQTDPFLRLPQDSYPGRPFLSGKFYFTPGDTGFKVLKHVFDASASASAGSEPETARWLAVQGAEILLYPTATGAEPILNGQQRALATRYAGHAAANWFRLLLQTGLVRNRNAL